ncbi:MAG: DUF721 domain-containing protein [candidate division Zixibacteria bacterium]|nr:DUF721 domain-containing protein [candidate division Zixibacteria bacterium]
MPCRGTQHSYISHLWRKSWTLNIPQKALSKRTSDCIIVSYGDFGPSGEQECRVAKPELIASILNRQLAQSGVAKRVKEASVEHLWPEIMGPEVAQHSRVTRNEFGRVFIAVDSPEWRQELLYRREAIIEILNGRLGGEVVSDILFTGP